MTGPSACPACGAAVRPDAPWCTLCYADLRPAPEPEPEPVPELLASPAPSPRPTGGAPADGAPGADATPTWPCTVCGTPNAIDRDLCLNCGNGFLAGVSTEPPGLALPVVGDLTRLGRGQRMALAGGVVAVFLVLLLLGGLLLG